MNYRNIVIKIINLIATVKEFTDSTTRFISITRNSLKNRTPLYNNKYIIIYLMSII